MAKELAMVAQPRCRVTTVQATFIGSKWTRIILSGGRFMVQTLMLVDCFRVGAS